MVSIKLVEAKANEIKSDKPKSHLSSIGGKLRRNEVPGIDVLQKGSKGVRNIQHIQVHNKFGRKKLYRNKLGLKLVTSSTAQGGGGSFKSRKPIGEVSCCDAWMAERIQWTEGWLELCFLECLEWLQWSPHPQLLDVVWCSAVVFVAVAWCSGVVVVICKKRSAVAVAVAVVVGVWCNKCSVL